MQYEEFERRVRAAGLEPKRCTHDHWQIRGGSRNPIVNFWPSAKGGSKVYAQGERKARYGTVEKAIEAAGVPKPVELEVVPPWEDKPVERVGLIRWVWRMIW